MSICQLQIKRLPFGAIPAGNVSTKIDEIFKDLPNEFGIADDILAVGYDSDGKDNDETMKSIYKYADR